MSEGPERQPEQTPEELAALLAAHLSEAVGEEARRRLEPGVVFSAELAWSHAQDEAAS